MLEPVEICADWWRHATWGVNALLAAAEFPRKAGDAAPPAVTVLEETRHGWVARIGKRGAVPRKIAEAGPILAVCAFGEVKFDVRPQRADTGAWIRAGEASVLAQYVLHKRQSEVAARDAYYTLRALRDSTLVMHGEPHAEARRRQGVMLLSLSDLRQARVMEPIEDIVVVAGVIATFKLYETTPYG